MDTPSAGHDAIDEDWMTCDVVCNGFRRRPIDERHILGASRGKLAFLTSEVSCPTQKGMGTSHCLVCLSVSGKPNAVPQTAEGLYFTKLSQAQVHSRFSRSLACNKKGAHGTAPLTRLQINITPN